ncbi:MAG: CRISPR-associated endoribonuclease [Candidatus Tectimicrobiota bacterium]|nr:MAG: CRISPR-associated endoribonuclease [Candidatus Tectomicrobia bacterium]
MSSGWERSTVRLRLTLEAQSGRELVLPRHYNALVQGFLYRHLDRWLARTLHDEGLPDPQNIKRRLKLFTFSRLQGRFRLLGERMAFQGPVRMVVASPLEPFLRSLLEHLLTVRRLRLGTQEVRLLDVVVEPLPAYTSPVQVEALSPITVYRTLYTAEGKRKTYYVPPFEEEFERLLLENLRRKLRAWRAWLALLGLPEAGDRAATAGTGVGEEAYPPGEGAEARIRPLKVSLRDEHILFYKGTVIKAWTGVYELELPPKLMELAFDAGLGAKNSQGFGCIGPWRPKETGKEKEGKKKGGKRDAGRDSRARGGRP